MNNAPTNYKEYLTYLKNKDSKEWHELYSQALSYLRHLYKEVGWTPPENFDKWNEVDMVIYAERRIK